MRLITHNFLRSNVKGTTKGYPLQIEATQVIVEESPVDREMVKALIPKLDYAAVLAASRQLASQQSNHQVPIPTLPDQLAVVESDDKDKEQTIADLYKVLFDIHVTEGHLICPDTGRRFPINQGIPNMILHEDEL